MFGNLINNSQLNELIKNKVIEISDWNISNLSLVHYTLHPETIKIRQPDGKWVTVHNFNENHNPYKVEPNGYVIVTIKERIKLNSDYIVGEFRPASNLIEDGFGLTTGKIDKRYGTSNKEVVVFGMKNYLNVHNEIKENTRIAHVSFFDLRGVSGKPGEVTEDEMLQRAIRIVKRVYDDGPNYGEGTKK